MLPNVGSTEQLIVFFGKVGRIASEDVVLHLTTSKCMSIILLSVRSITIEQIAAELPGLRG